MPRPTARVLALLELLEQGGTHTVATLASRLEVDERTVRRYVEHLRDLDVPVRSVRGRYGGYRLGPGFRLPPLMLTDDEALAVLLGLALAPHSPGATDGGTAADSAAAKLRRVLPDALADRLTALLDTVEFTAPMAAPGATVEGRTLLLFAEAARDRTPVAISYVDRGGVGTERVLHPYGIVAHAGRWYVTAADSHSGEVRTFRLDRVSAPTLRRGTFETPDGFDAVATVTTSLAHTPWRHPVRLRVRATAAHVRTALPASVADVSDLDDQPGWLRVELRAERLTWLPAVLVGLDRPFVVDAPAELRDLVRDLARRLAQSVDPAARPR